MEKTMILGKELNNKIAKMLTAVYISRVLMNNKISGELNTNKDRTILDSG